MAVKTLFDFLTNKTKENKDFKLAIEIASKVAEFGGKSYFVGGFVRDVLLGCENKDIDIEIHEIEPDKLISILENFGEVNKKGASFGVLGIKGFDLDIAQPRLERATGRGHRDFEAFVDPFVGVETAAKRRDFTINSIMADILTGEIIDVYGGVPDLRAKLLRCVDTETFIEDPLRVFRAAQFAARFDLRIVRKTASVIKRMDTSSLAKEVVFIEMKKALLKTPKPSVFFEVLRELGHLDLWFPEVKDLIGVCANAKNHPEGDTWNHTMRVIDYAATIKHKSSNPAYFMIAALCHDFGKPLVESTDELGYSHAYNHEELGVDVTERFIRRLTVEVDLLEYVKDMVLNHMKTHQIFLNNSRVIKSHKLFDNSTNPADLCLLALADASSKTSLDPDNNVHIDEYNFLIDRLNLYEIRKSEPMVTGKDLLREGYKPCKLFKEIIKEARKLHFSGVDKDHVLKHIHTVYGKKLSLE